MNIANLTNALSTQVTDLLPGALAAAEAINKTCELGGPVQVTQCDDKFDPNAAAACGRQAVDQKVLALASTVSSFPDQFNAITFAAGIPTVGNNSYGTTDTTSKLSFPTFFTLKDFMSEITVAKAIGGKKIAMVALDLPSIKFLIDLGVNQAKAVGITVLPTITVPPTSTDLAQAAGQVISSGADIVIPVLSRAQVAPLLNALTQQGADLKKLHVIQNLQTNTPKFVRQIGKPAVGLIATSFAWSTEDRTNPAIKRFFAEMKAAKQPSGRDDVSVSTINAWGSVHLIADVMKGAPTMDAATLVQRLNAAGAIDLHKYGLNNVDYTKPAFPNDPALSQLRLFSDDIAAFQINEKLQAVPLSKDWISATKATKLKLPVKAN